MSGRGGERRGGGRGGRRGGGGGGDRGRSSSGRGRSRGRGGGMSRGGGSSRGRAGSAPTGGPVKASINKPTVPHKINRELGLVTEHRDKSRRGGNSDDEGAAGKNAFGGSNSMPFAREDTPEDDTHAGPGNSTRSYVAGGGTRAQGGGGLYGISNRKAERKAARQARKQQPTMAQMKDAWNKQQQQQQQGDGKKSGGKKQQPPPTSDSRPKKGATSKDSAASQAPPESRKRKVESTASAPRKQAKRPAKPPSASRAKFEELLGDLNPGNRDAIAAEDALQRQLAKKLGLKSKRGTMGGDDGLDDIVRELDLLGPDEDNDDDDHRGEELSSGDSEDDMDAFSENSEDSLDALGADFESEGDEEGDMSEDSEFMDGEVGSQDEDEAGSSGSESEGDEAEEEGDGIYIADEEGDSEDEKGGKNAHRSGQDGAAGSAPVPEGKYLPPALRAAAAAAAAATPGAAESAADERLMRRVRGLLNRISESSLPKVAAELAALFATEGRRTVCHAINAELLSAVIDGPRATDRFAAVTAAAVAGLAAEAKAGEIIAEFLSALAARLEQVYEEENTLACHNLTMVAAQLLVCGAVDAGLLFGLLEHFTTRFSETDVAMMLTLLKASGFALRGADPAAMKDFVVAVHARAGEATAAGQITSRAEVMLSLVVDIKNNKKRSGRDSGPPAVLPPPVLAWLKSSGIVDVCLRNLTWPKLLRTNKKGLWWLPTAEDAAGLAPLSRAGLDGEGGGELLRLAAGQRMNTDARRAAFCAVMGSEDCVDAFERLLRLGLKGEQERELVRVPLECCLQEASWNPYYAHLALKLTSASKGHKITLQYCLWDQFKEAATAPPRRAANLARFVATVIANFGLSISLFKVVDFRDVMIAKEQLFWNSTFEQLLLICPDEAAVVSVFSRLAGLPALQALATAMVFYLQHNFAPWAIRRLNEAAVTKKESYEKVLVHLKFAQKTLGDTSSAVLAGG